MSTGAKPRESKGSRRESRQFALQFLYGQDVNPSEDIAAALERFWISQERDPPCEVRAFAELLALGALEKRLEIDAVLTGYLKNWTLDRLGVVERNILRLALYEMRHREDIPPVVSINEAIELAKRYGADDAGGFVNGILDRAREDILRPARSAAGG